MVAVLGRSEILKLIRAKPPLIEGYVDLEVQLQPSGFDLTLREVRFFESSGSIDFDNSRRELPDTSQLEFKDDSLILKPGAYLVVFNEIINMPLNIVAIGRPRSSLLRAGATVESAVWDPGYSGRSKALLLVFNPHGIRLYRNARILQLVFLRVLGDVGEGYRGVYRGER